MARFTFGGDLTHVVAYPDSSLGGALKLNPGVALTFYATASTSTAETDFLVDNDGDGVFETAVSSITVRSTGYLPDFQGRDGVSILYIDVDPSDSDTRRVQLRARDIAAAGLLTSGGFLPIANATPGTTITIRKVGGVWPASYDADGRPIYTGGSSSAGVRPTARDDIYVRWAGVEPFPPWVASGTGGALQGVDKKEQEPA